MSSRRGGRLVIRFRRMNDRRTLFLWGSVAVHLGLGVGLMLVPTWGPRKALVGESMVVELAGPLPGPPAGGTAVAPPPKPAQPPPPSKPPAPKNASVVEETVRKRPKKEKEKKERKEEAPPAAPVPGPPAPSTPQPTGGAPEGSTGAGIQAMTLGGLETSWYGLAVKAALESRWVKPILEDVTQPLSVVVTFDIERQGTVGNARILVSSGVPSLDRSALRAVLDASPLPPLPPTWSGDVLEGAKSRFDWRPGRD